MANVTITQLPQAGAITGQELVPVVQNGQTVQTTTAAISASPSQTQTFLTVNQEATLINSRALSGGTGIGLTDGGALSTLQINLNAVSGSLESSGVGLIAKTGGTVTGRTLVAGTSGLSITNGNGVSGNPSISLTGALAGIPGLAGTGLISIIGGSTASQVTILGTANQITVVNGNGNGNPTISISDNPTLPGTGAVLMPGGTTAERPGGTAGQVRFNSDTGFMEYYTGSMWANLSAGASIANNIGGGLANQILVQNGPSSTTFITAPTVANTFLEWDGVAFTWSANPLGTVTSIDVSGGTTGLTYSGGPITTSGTITMAGTLITTNGGTGLSSYTAGDITYYATGTALSKLAIGSSTFILTSTGTAPQWSDPAGISVNTATNVAGGGANQIVFNTASGTTSFITAPTVANTFLEWSGSAFQWATTVTSIDVSGGTTGLTTSGGPVTTSGTITLAGTLAVANGGTGQTSYTDGELLIGNSTGNTLSKATLTAGAGISVTNGTGSITIAATGVASQGLSYAWFIS
jgi:trimeric autotransporter adhesin